MCLRNTREQIQGMYSQRLRIPFMIAVLHRHKRVVKVNVVLLTYDVSPCQQKAKAAWLKSLVDGAGPIQ